MKNITFITKVLTSVVVVSSSVMALGANAQSLSSATSKVGVQNFCTRFPASSQKYDQDIVNQVTKLQNQVGTESSKVQANRQTSDNTLQQDRTKWAQNRQNIYAKLNARATTSAQKQAVATFQSTIEAAVTAREAAVDAARTAYRQGADQVISQHQAASENTLTTFKAAVQAAIQQATSQCSSGTTPETVKQTFNAALQAARSARTTSTQQVDKVGPKLQTLAKTRDAAIQQAMQTYQSSMKAAVASLRAAFAQTSGSTTSGSGQ